MIKFKGYNMAEVLCFLKSVLKKADKKIYEMFPFKIGDYVFKRYDADSQPNLYGVIAFRDGETKRVELGRSVKLTEYLSSITPEGLADGRFGRGPRDMKKVEIFYLEVENKDDVAKTYNILNKQIYKKA